MLSNEIREYLFTTCIEGGSNYWAEVHARRLLPPNSTLSFSERLFKELAEGRALDIYDSEQNTYIKKLTMEMISSGEEIMIKEYPSHYGDILKENWDAESSDIWLQCALFNEIIYG